MSATSLPCSPALGPIGKRSTITLSQPRFDYLGIARVYHDRNSISVSILSLTRTLWQFIIPQPKTNNPPHYSIHDPEKRQAMQAVHPIGVLTRAPCIIPLCLAGFLMAFDEKVMQNVAE